MVPLHPVQLSFHYYEVGGAEEFKNDSPGITYWNKSKIDYFATDSVVPFDIFRVQITIFHQESGTYGPAKNDTVTYGRSHIQHASMYSETCL